MMIILSFVAFAGFLISLAVHLSTFSNLNLLHDFPIVWGLHLGAMAVCVPMIISEGKETGWKKQGARQSWQKFTGHFPGWSRLVIIGFAVYAFVNFFSGIMYSEKNGDVVERDGRYYVSRRDGREITKQQYDDSQRNLLRMFSGHWMLFFLYPACYYLFRRPTRIF